MNSHQIAEQLAIENRDRSLNEADTRHQILNRLLHDVLAWPQSSVSCEEKVNAGYIDLVLRDKASRPVLVIEAKRAGIFFNLPIKIRKSTEPYKMVRLRTLSTDQNISAAVNQVAKYCPEIGCPFACITNGHEYIVFRSFIPGQKFIEADALVIKSLDFFAAHHTKACDILSYHAVTSDRSLFAVFNANPGTKRDLFYPKTGIIHYDTPFSQNPLARYLEPIARRYFKDIKAVDKRLMDNCYVFSRETKQAQDGMRARLYDSITPYFENNGAQDISEVRTGGKLAQRIAKAIAQKGSGEVLILYGGKGAGKSTFLRRVLYYEPPQDFTLYAFPIIIDCLNAPQSKEELTEFFWDHITEALNLDNVLGKQMDDLLALFEDRFAIAKAQDLSGFTEGTADYLRERNRLVCSWKDDKLYVAKRLKNYWEKQGKRAVIAFDNTDQLAPVLQDHCFLSAQNIANDLQCVVIISMREERYCRARTSGVLDAYQNTGFHLAAPELLGVFTKRIRLVIKDLQNARFRISIEGLYDDAPFGALCAFFSSCLLQFKDEKNALRHFLQECSRDNVRMALEFFTQFLISGYTHVEEMVNNPNWTVIEHQVIRPMMVPQRHNYDEDKSLVPNVFQCRTAGRGSHFTTIRILRELRHGENTTPDRGSFVRVDALVDEYETRFGMRQDCEAALDIMLRHGLIEANNRLDSYRIERSGSSDHELIYADEVKITAFGVYALDYLAPAFTYLDLISLDCGLSEESLYECFVNAATTERQSAINGDKEERLNSRIERAELFLQYLGREEAREKAEFLLNPDEVIVPFLANAFQSEKPRVLASARRNIPRYNSGGKSRH